MQLLQRILRDIRRGENIDLYITVVAAIGVAIVSALGIDVTALINSLILTILGLLAFSALQNRHNLEDLSKKIHSPNQAIFLKEFPTSFQADFEHSRNLLLMGVSLSTVMLNPIYHNILERKARRGDKIKILFVHPEGIAVEAATTRSPWEVKADSTKLRIKSALEFTRHLITIAPKTVEVRTVNYQMSYGAYLFNFENDDANGVLYTENFSYKSGHIPKQAFQSDTEFYKFYKSEIFLIWEHGKNWDFSEQGQRIL